MLRLACLPLLALGCQFQGATPLADEGGRDAAIAEPDAAAAETDIDGSVPPDAAGPRTLIFQNGVGGYASMIDTTIDNTVPGMTFGGDSNFRWEFDGTGDAKIALFRFDAIFGAGVEQIPPTAVILAANLSGVVTNDGGAGRMRRALTDWDEASTFTSFAGDGTVGLDTDFDENSEIAAPTALGAYDLDVTADLVFWAANLAEYRGWGIFPSSPDRVEVDSSEAAVLADRPRLEVTFQ